MKLSEIAEQIQDLINSGFDPECEVLDFDGELATQIESGRGIQINID